MALTEVVRMPGADYQAICDAVRAKTGGTELLKSGDIPGAIEGISGGDAEMESSLRGLIDGNETNLVTRIPEGTTHIRENLFYSLSNVKITSIPDSVQSIAYCAFAGCLGLTTLSLPEGISIDGMAFVECITLAEVTFRGLPTLIAEDAFEGCVGLTFNVPWAEGEVDGAPWGAPSATINYNYVAE